MAVTNPISTKELYDKVNSHYSALALYETDPSSNPLAPNSETKCEVNDDYHKQAKHVTKVALSFGYSANELADLPEGANLGVSCGNPLAVAGLKTGETVIDLGSGAGFDVFLAAKKVGEQGTAIGVDMSQEMIARARANAEKSSVTNVKFIESSIAAIDLPTSSADCIISNCVINLVPAEDKHLVFREIFRLLRPGGRVALSDILGKKKMTPEMQKDMSLYVGCISGASMVREYEEWLVDAGFEDILIVDKKNDLNIYKEDMRQIETGLGDAEASCCSSNKTTETDSAASCCGADERSTPKAEMSSPCCSPDMMEEEKPYCCGKPEVSVRPTGPKLRIGNGCGTSHQIGNTESSVTLVDFNEWVGSFSIYAVKP